MLTTLPVALTRCCPTIYIKRLEEQPSIAPFGVFEIKGFKVWKYIFPSLVIRPIDFDVSQIYSVRTGSPFISECSSGSTIITLVYREDYIYVAHVISLLICPLFDCRATDHSAD